MHTPSPHQADNPQSCALYRLYAFQSTLETLRGVSAQTIAAIGYDQLLDELADICAAFDELHAVRYELNALQAAFATLLELLESAGDQRLASTGLYALLEPFSMQQEACLERVSALL